MATDRPLWESEDSALDALPVLVVYVVFLRLIGETELERLRGREISRLAGGEAVQVMPQRLADPRHHEILYQNFSFMLSSHLAVIKMPPTSYPRPVETLARCLLADLLADPEDCPTGCLDSGFIGIAVPLDFQDVRCN